jgi:hypothetical protein
MRKSNSSFHIFLFFKCSLEQKLNHIKVVNQLACTILFGLHLYAFYEIHLLIKNIGVIKNIGKISFNPLNFYHFCNH